MVQKRKLYSRLLPELVCVSLVVMWGQGSQVTASPQPLKEATFKTLPVSDVMFTGDVLWEKPARSRLECSVMCRGDGQCLMVTFQPGTHRTPGSCRSHGKRKSPQDQQEPMPGARSFNLAVRDIWIQNNCLTDSDSTEPMAACFSGQCLCDGGYFFDYTLNACVSACMGRFGRTYLPYLDMVLAGHYYYVSIPNGNVSTCLSTCSADPQCTNFSHRLLYDRCFYKYVTAQDFPQDWIEEESVVHYQKICI